MCVLACVCAGVGRRGNSRGEDSRSRLARMILLYCCDDMVNTRGVCHADGYMCDLHSSIMAGKQSSGALSCVASRNVWWIMFLMLLYADPIDLTPPQYSCAVCAHDTSYS